MGLFWLASHPATDLHDRRKNKTNSHTPGVAGTKAHGVLVYDVFPSTRLRFLQWMADSRRFWSTDAAPLLYLIKNENNELKIDENRPSTGPCPRVFTSGRTRDLPGFVFRLTRVPNTSKVFLSISPREWVKNGQDFRCQSSGMSPTTAIINH